MIRFRRLPEDIYQKFGLLKELLMKKSNVIFAYLFGGLLRGRINPLSDVDIAVFVKDLKRLDYIELFRKITNILNTDEVDLVILNNSSTTLTGRILKNRMILVDKALF